MANWLIGKIGGVPLHDYGCSLKAYRRDVIEGVRLYGEMHRFIPIYAKWQGAKVTELPVLHRAGSVEHGKFGYFSALPFGIDRNEAVHFAVEPNAFYDVSAIGF